MVHIVNGVDVATQTTRMVPPKNPRSPYDRGGNGGPPPHWRRGLGGGNPEPYPAFHLAQILFYVVGAAVCYVGYLGFKAKIREHLERLRLECQQQEQPANFPQGSLAVSPKGLFLKKCILLIGGACFDPNIFVSA